MDVRLLYFLYGFCFAICLVALFFHGVLEKVRERSAKIDAVLKDNAGKTKEAEKKMEELQAQLKQVEELNDRVK